LLAVISYCREEYEYDYKYELTGRLMAPKGDSLKPRRAIKTNQAQAHETGHIKKK